MKIKIIVWNINRASYIRKSLWEYLNELDFDVGLFQEVYMIPYSIRKKYYSIRGEMNVILIKKNIGIEPKKEDIFSNNNNPNIDTIMDICVGAKIELTKTKLVIFSIYNYIGFSNSDFYTFLKVMLNYIRYNKDKLIIIGGDFNMDEKFKGNYKTLGKLAKNLKEELYKLGYYDVLFSKFDSESFTFIAHKNKEKYQLDYLFIPTYSKVNKIEVGNRNNIFNQKPKLSDHLPIILTIDLE